VAGSGQHPGKQSAGLKRGLSPDGKDSIFVPTGLAFLAALSSVPFFIKVIDMRP
jgi:hypothetical protein